MGNVLLDPSYRSFKRLGILLTLSSGFVLDAWNRGLPAFSNALKYVLPASHRTVEDSILMLLLQGTRAVARNARSTLCPFFAFGWCTTQESIFLATLGSVKWS